MSHAPSIAKWAANENLEGALRHPRSCSRGDYSSDALLTGPERTALAMLRCGRNFAEASESSGVAVARLLALWKRQSAD